MLISGLYKFKLLMIKADQIVPYSALYIDMQYRHLFNTLWSYVKPID
jgi:hypothetical protein